MNNAFDEQYYRSRNYVHYLKRRFGLLAQDIKELHLSTGYSNVSRIIDFGCGYGGLMAELYSQGLTNIVGTDISQWAIDHGKQRFPALADRLQYYNRNLLAEPHVGCLMLDVLEHIPEYEIEILLKLARKGCAGYVIVRIPVCDKEHETFVLPVSNNDPTHITCHTKAWWTDVFNQHGFNKVMPFTRHSIYDSPGVFVAMLSARDDTCGTAHSDCAHRLAR